MSGMPRLIKPPDADWVSRALCAHYNPEWWFSGARGKRAKALAICGKCAVKAECLAFAMTLPRRQRWGVWGGVPMFGKDSGRDYSKERTARKKRETERKASQDVSLWLWTDGGVFHLRQLRRTQDLR